jgi:HK97 family phage major capsid protein/HK97 family phage prohead protease
MPMNVNPDESESDFMSRCMSDHSDHPHDQAVAICMDIWRGRSTPGIEHREAGSVRPGAEFVLGDSTVLDRHGTYVGPDWDLGAFRNNNIAFFNHDKNFPIGTWENVRVEAGKLIGKLKLAEEGTSARIDEIIRLIRQGILKAVSVGFRAIGNPEQRSGFPHLKKVQLLEASIVGVGSNPNALMLARALGTSPETIRTVFGEQAAASSADGKGGHNGEKADNSVSRKTIKMETITQRIEDAQKKVTELRDALNAHLADSGSEPDEAAITVREELTGKVAAAQRNLESLEEAERQLAARTVQTRQTSGEQDRSGTQTSRKPFAQVANKPKPADYVIRTLVGLVDCHRAAKRHEPLSLMQAIANRYGEDGKIDDESRIVAAVATRGEEQSVEQVLFQIRAASAPATTTTSGWASQLVETSFSGFMELLMPASVYPGLSARGLRMNFGRAGVISIPTRSATPTIAGSFVGEGNPIPVRQAAFTAQTFTPKKMAVISGLTREIAEHSTPALEGLIRNAIQEDTSVALDTILLDATAASAVRPAGIRNGVSVTTATAGGGFAALVGDLKALVGALITASNGNLRAPVWIMNPIQALSIAVTQNAGGDFPFAGDINGGTFQGYPVIQSSTVTAGMMILIDAADFVAIEGAAPRFDVSDNATLHFEDTTPLAIGTAGSPATVAAPVRSLWQTDSMAIRMIMDVNWGLRRAALAWTQSVTW